MAETKKEGEGDEDEDPRLLFIMNYLMKSMKIKQERWNKLVAIEENRVSFTFRMNQSTLSNSLLTALFSRNASWNFSRNPTGNFYS